MSQKKHTPAITPLGWAVLAGLAFFVLKGPTIRYLQTKW